MLKIVFDLDIDLLTLRIVVVVVNHCSTSGLLTLPLPISHLSENYLPLPNSHYAKSTCVHALIAMEMFQYMPN